MNARATSFDQWAGAATGVAGTLLLALPSEASKWGFVLYLVSNFFWIRFGLQTRTFGLIVQNAVYTASSLVGIWFWFTKSAA